MIKTTYTLEQILEASKTAMTTVLNKELTRDSIQIIFTSENDIYLMEDTGEAQIMKIGHVSIKESYRSEHVAVVRVQLGEWTTHDIHLHKGTVDQEFNVPFLGIWARLRHNGLKRTIQHACDHAITVSIMKYVYDYQLNYMNA